MALLVNQLWELGSPALRHNRTNWQLRRPSHFQQTCANRPPCTALLRCRIRATGATINPHATPVLPFPQQGQHLEVNARKQTLRCITHVSQCTLKHTQVSAGPHQSAASSAVSSVPRNASICGSTWNSKRRGAPHRAHEGISSGCGDTLPHSGCAP